jgi:hypothetical protein
VYTWTKEFIAKELTLRIMRFTAAAIFATLGLLALFNVRRGLG